MKALRIFLTILLFGVVVTIGLVVIPTPGTKADSSKAAEGATKVIGVELGAKSITLAPASPVKAPTGNVKKRDLQPDAGEKFDPSEIRQALSELDAIVKRGGSTQEIQEKKDALKAAIDRGIKKDPKGALSFVFQCEIFGPDPLEPGPELSLLVQIDPDLAIALLDQVLPQHLMD